MSQSPELVTLYSTQPPLRVTGIRGTTPPAMVGGFGGWTLVPRPRRRALTRWTGINPRQLQLSILFDGFPSRSVEQQCATLEQMAQPPVKRQPPPIIHVVGAVPHPEIGYVIGDGNGGDGITWDTSEQMYVYSEQGFRVRAHAVVTLIEYVADDHVGSSSAAARARQQAAAKAASAAAKGGGVPATKRTYTVRSGDTLFTIAQRQLGNAARWTEIAQLNGIASPYTITAGQVVKLP